MLRTSGVELLGIVDPPLAWNIDSRGEHRVPRRRRTYVFIDSKQRLHVKHLSQDENPTDKDLKSKEMPVSESEKLGVTILGHRFDGSLEGVPIKKRLLLSHSPSSSRGSPPSSSEASDHVLESQCSHHVNKKLESHVLSSGTPGAADFSGISILAAAACSSRLGGENMCSEASVSKDEEYDCPQKGHISLGSLDEGSSDAGVSDRKHDMSEMSLSILGLSAVEDGSCTRDARLPDENTSCSNNIHTEDDKVSDMEKMSSKNLKFHWDLNMDAQDFADDEDADLIGGCIDSDVCNEKSKNELCLDPDGDKTKLVEEDVSNNILKDMKCTSMDTPAEPKKHYSCNDAVNVSLPSVCHSLPQMASDLSNTEEFKPGNPMQNSVNASHVTNILPKPYPRNGEAHNPCSNSDDPCSGSGPAAGPSNRIFTQTSCIKSVFDQLNVCPPIDHASIQEVSQDEVHDNSGVSQSSMQMDVDRQNRTQGRSCMDEDFESVPVDSHTCRSTSSNKLVTCADGDKIGKMETSESHSHHGHQSAEDTESSHSNRERHGSPKQCDCNINPVTVCFGDQKDAKAYDDLFVAALATNTKSMPSNMVSFDDAGKNLTSGVVKKQDENVPEDYHAAHPTEMGKIECHRDDESQYEDGELRESLLHDWGTDGDEYVDDEHVDYGSDERENYMCQDAINGSASAITPNFGTSECKDVTLSENCGIHPVADQASKKSLEAKSEQNSESLDTEGVKEKTNLLEEKHIKGKDGNQRLERSIQDTPCSSTDINSVSYAKHFSKGDSCLKKPDLSASLKVNSSGMNQSPIDREITAGPARGLHVKGELIPDTASTGESCKKLSDSKHSRDLLSRTERKRPSELLRSTDGTCNLGSRANRNGDPNHTANARFSRKAEPFHLQEARSKGYPSNESLNQWVQTQHERHRYYGSAGYVQPAPKNALEAAAAKVESNGFAVAPDGTVVDPSHLESSGWTLRRNASASAHAAYRSHTGRLSSSRRDRLPRSERNDTLAFDSQSKRRISREVSPDRHLNDNEGPYRRGPRMLSAGRKEKYTFQVSGDRIDSAVPGRRAISHRNHTPPSQRESSLPRRHGISRSRSRTRSPHTWASPTRNDGGRVMDHHRYRHCGRSPTDFRSDDRGELVKIPYRHASYVDGLPDFVPHFRNHPSQPSRAINERKDLESNLRRREYRVYRRSLERSPPERPFSRSHRFDVLDSRMDGEEYFQQLHPGRHHEFINVGKRPRLDGYEDRRGHVNRYEMLISPSSKQYPQGELRRLRYVDGNEYRLESSRLKTDPEIEDRGTLRGFLGGCEDHLRSSPRRSNGEKGYFRYGREVRLGANSKSSGIQECDKDANAMRRRLL